MLRAQPDTPHTVRRKEGGRKGGKDERLLFFLGTFFFFFFNTGLGLFFAESLRLGLGFGLSLTLPFVGPAAMTLGCALVPSAPAVIAVVFFTAVAPFFAGDALGLGFFAVAAAAAAANLAWTLVPKDRRVNPSAPRASPVTEDNAPPRAEAVRADAWIVLSPIKLEKWVATRFWSSDSENMNSLRLFFSS
jgi:hypothetical protein